MKENMGFEDIMGKALEQKGFVGGEDNYADTENRQTYSLEEEREFRELIPKYESFIEKLEDLESKSIEYRNKQNQYFSDLNLELLDVNNTIDKYLKPLREYKTKKEKLNHLNKKNFQFHMNLDDINLPVTNEEKEINSLQKEVNELSEKIINENISEQLPILTEKSLKLSEKINSLRDLWYPEKPSDN